MEKIAGITNYKIYLSQFQKTRFLISTLCFYINSYNRFTIYTQDCYTGFTRVLQYFYKGFTIVLQEFYNTFTRVLQINYLNSKNYINYYGDFYILTNFI